MTAEQKEFLRQMADKYSLTKDDFFSSPQGWVIIRRTGIDKIQGKEKISIELETHSLDNEMVVIKATGKLKDVAVSSFGEANSKNCKNSYPVAMAEKRALSRVVLKLVGAYGMGIYSEDETFD